MATYLWPVFFQRKLPTISYVTANPSPQRRRLRLFDDVIRFISDARKSETKIKQNDFVSVSFLFYFTCADSLTMPVSRCGVRRCLERGCLIMTAVDGVTLGPLTQTRKSFFGFSPPLPSPTVSRRNALVDLSKEKGLGATDGTPWSKNLVDPYNASRGVARQNRKITIETPRVQRNRLLEIFSQFCDTKLWQFPVTFARAEKHFVSGK